MYSTYLVHMHKVRYSETLWEQFRVSNGLIYCGRLCRSRKIIQNNELETCAPEMIGYVDTEAVDGGGKQNAQKRDSLLSYG